MGLSTAEGFYQECGQSRTGTQANFVQAQENQAKNVVRTHSELFKKIYLKYLFNFFFSSRIVFIHGNFFSWKPFYYCKLCLFYDIHLNFRFRLLDSEPHRKQPELFTLIN